MSRIRLLKSSTVYDRYPRSFYVGRPNLASSPFQQQMEALLGDGFSFGDAWKHYLEETGRYEVLEVLVNVEPAQKRWAAEHGIRYSEANWAEEILAAQIAEFSPDVWFCHSWLAPSQRLRLRDSCRSIRYVIGYDGALNHAPDQLSGCDAVLTCVRESAAFYSQHGFRGYWMPWGFDPRLLARLKPSRARYPVSFCGSMIMQDNGGHFDRPRLLDGLQAEAEIAVFCGDLRRWQVERALVSQVLRRRFNLAVRTLQVYPALTRLRRTSRGERFGLEMLQTLADSKITINIHGHGIRTAANIRLFEATGAGTCLLTDWKDDLPCVFEPGKEVVAFRSQGECAEKLRYLLQHDAERTSIAAAGHRRCLRDHHIGNHIASFANEVLDRL